MYTSLECAGSGGGLSFTITFERSAPRALSALAVLGRWSEASAAPAALWTIRRCCAPEPPGLRGLWTSLIRRRGRLPGSRPGLHGRLLLCSCPSRTSIGTSAPTTRHLSITTLNTHAELTFRPLVLAITFRLPSHAHASHPRRGAPRVRATRPGRPRDREASRAADRSPPWTDHTRAPGDGARASLPR